MRDVAFSLIAIGFNLYKTDDLDVIYKAFVETAVQRGKETYEKEFQKISSDGRKDIVGDNYLDINATSMVIMFC